MLKGLIEIIKSIFKQKKNIRGALVKPQKDLDVPALKPKKKK